MTFNQPPPPPPPGYGPPPAPPPGYGPPGGYYYGPPQAPGAPAPHRARSASGPMLAVFIGALLGIAVLVGVVVLANQPAPPKPCPGDTLCPPEPRPTLPPDRTPGPNQTSGPTLPPHETAAPTPAGQTAPPGQPTPSPASNAPPFVGGTVYRSASLGYSFEYDSSSDGWTMVKSDDAMAQLQIGPVELDVIGFAGDTSVDAALQSIYSQTDSFIIGRAPDERPYDALLGPSIGYIPGGGGVFTGTWKQADGTPGEPVGITIMASTNGHATVVVIVLVTNPDNGFGDGTLDHAGRKEVDKIIKTFLWEGGG